MSHKFITGIPCAKLRRDRQTDRQTDTILCQMTVRVAKLSAHKLINEAISSIFQVILMNDTGR